MTSSTTKPQQLPQQLAAAALAAFASLPKTGKPQHHEFTVLAAIAITLPPNDPFAVPWRASDAHKVDNAHFISLQNDPIVIALATGTKSLPGVKRARDGSSLHDCHAEVLCRRAFVRWAYAEIEHGARLSSSTNASSLPASRVFQIVPTEAKETGRGTQPCSEAPTPATISSTDYKVELIPGVQLHMFVSAPPCGDAAILDADATAEHSHPHGRGRTGAKPMVKRRRSESADETCGDEASLQSNSDQSRPFKPLLVAVDAATALGGSEPIGGNTTALIDGRSYPTVGTRIGTANAVGTCLPEARDVESYAGPQMIGVVRRKPGKGAPTLSVSCSDKLMKWTLLGVQGALLSSLLLTPLYLQTIATLVDLGRDSKPARDDEPAVAFQEAKGGTNRVFAARTSRARALQRACVHRTRDVRDRLQGTRFATPTVPDISITSVDGRYLHEHGLCASEQRRVPCGSSVTWWADVSSSWKRKQARILIPVAGHPIVNAGSTNVDGRAQDASPVPMCGIADVHPQGCVTERILSKATVLLGGTLEATTSLIGIRAGASRRGNDPVPEAKRSSLCRPALLSMYLRAEAALRNGPQMSLAKGDGHCLVAGNGYGALKGFLAEDYVASWRLLRAHPTPFEGWIDKPDSSLT